jgi:hypothetical protein
MKYIKAGIIGSVALVGVLSLFINDSRASIFPNDAKTVYKDYVGDGSGLALLTKPSSLYSILYLSTLQNTNQTNARIRIYCGATVILDVSKAQVNTNIERFNTQLCNSDLTVTLDNQTGTDRTSVRVIYVSYDLTLVPNYMVTLASVSIPSEPLLSNLASGSIVPVYATMTAGDLIIALSLFALITLQILWIFFRQV